MRIIKHGSPKYSKPDRKFRCSYCGCVFETEYDEYEYAGSQYNEAYYKSTCPECHNIVYGDGRQFTD